MENTCIQNREKFSYVLSEKSFQHYLQQISYHRKSCIAFSFFYAKKSSHYAVFALKFGNSVTLIVPSICKCQNIFQSVPYNMTLRYFNSS